jgi:hypothetical protein
LETVKKKDVADIPPPPPPPPPPLPEAIFPITCSSTVTDGYFSFLPSKMHSQCFFFKAQISPFAEIE